MTTEPKGLVIPQLSDIALLWDNEQNDFVVAYRKDFKKYTTVSLLDKFLFNSSGLAKTSDSYECTGYDNFLLLIDLDVTGTPTDILIAVEFSNDGVTWYKYMIGPFGDLRYEDGAGDKKECLPGLVIAKEIRVTLTSSGCDSSNTFRMSIDVILT